LQHALAGFGGERYLLALARHSYDLFYGKMVPINADHQYSFKQSLNRA
jgi:hypothetical protein